MSEDLSEIMKKMNSMLQNNEIPPDIKNMLEQLSSKDSNEPFKNSSEAFKNSNEASGISYDNSKESNNASNFDVDTLLKMKSIMDKINQNQPDPRSDLLKSLKPYLRDSRKRKVDEYIKLFRMGKVLEMMNPLGGEKKNDV